MDDTDRRLFGRLTLVLETLGKGLRITYWEFDFQRIPLLLNAIPNKATNR
jgi:hypothetical protein